MKRKTFPYFFLFILTALVLLAGVFYWQIKSETNNFSVGQNPVATSTSENIDHQSNTFLPPEQNPVPLSGPKPEISRGDINKKQIIFTFDTGSTSNSLEKILEVTKKHNVKPTFFVTGKFAEKYPESVTQMAIAGAEVFNHTYDHPYLTKITDHEIELELKNADTIISNLTGTTTQPYFRPPYGDRNAHVLEIAGQIGYQSVYWTLDALDWETGRTEQETKDRIYSNLKNGEIILMHVGDDITGNILDEVFTKIENDGYKIVSLTEGLK